MKVVVITGSAIGIGQALAQAFAKETLVFGLDIVEQTPMDNFKSYQCDIGDSVAVKSVFDNIANQVNHIDVLINNAGVWNDTRLSKGSYESQATTFKQAIDGGLSGSFFCTLAALPLLEQSTEANIINMQTEHILPGHYITGFPATGYDCAKFGLWRLTESWAIELKKKNIRVNGLNFGATDTPMLRAVSTEAAEAGMHADDIVRAVENILAQGENGDTGQSYLFGTNGTPRKTSLEQIDQLKFPRSGSISGS